MAICDAGVIVGTVVDQWDVEYAAAWRMQAGVIYGPVLLSGAGSATNDVAAVATNSVRVVGRDGDYQATAWGLVLANDGSFALSGTVNLVPGEIGEAVAITDAGDIAGAIREASSDPSSGTLDYIGFVLRSGTISLLPNASRRNRYAIGLDLNDSSVVGSFAADIGSSNHKACRWDSRNRIEKLAESYFPGEWAYSEAKGTNNMGEIVGFAAEGVGFPASAWLLR